MVVICNGELPASGVKSLMTSLQSSKLVTDAGPLGGLSAVEAMRRISQSLTRRHHRRHESPPHSRSIELAVVVHGVDRPGWREPGALFSLSVLAATPGVAVVCTVDHIHSSLMFDQKTTTTGKWVRQLPEW